MRRPSTILVTLLLLTVCFTFATLLQPRAAAWTRGAQSGDVLKILLGDGRRIFAEQVFRKADISFHSGYYPSIFDDKPKSNAMQGEQGGHDEAAHEKEMAMAAAHDWIEAFGRHFRVTEHTHLAAGKENEIMPWLKLSAELDPQRIETYTVAAYWLRKDLGKVKEAEEFLREGLRNNPTSYEILYELGCLYSEDRHDAQGARNVWELALKRWMSQESNKKDPDIHKLEQISVHLGLLEDSQGNYTRAIELLELAKKVSKNQIGIQLRINEILKKISDAKAAPAR